MISRHRYRQTLGGLKQGPAEPLTRNRRWVVKYTAAVDRAHLSGAQAQAEYELCLALGDRLDSLPEFFVAEAARARPALDMIAIQGRHRPEAKPGDRQALERFLDAHPDGYLVAVSAYAVVA
jgi:hypothetical protein